MAAPREWFEKNYYSVLGVPKTASERDVIKAYRKLAKQFHPDANSGDKAAEDRFKDLSAAYDVLGDAKKRKEYDDVRQMVASGVGFGGGSGGPSRPGAGPFAGGQAGGPGFRFDDLGDLFGGLFNRGGGGRPRSTGPQRGDDLETELHLSFLDAVNGVTTAVNVVSDASCATCRGSGAEPGTTPVACPACGGRGVLDENQGVFSFSRPCPTCGGSGRRIEHPCRTCKGSGVQRRSRQVKVRLPPGVADGQNVRLKGKGGAGRNGGPAGDLHVNVRVESHAIFGRKGRDLTVAVPVSYPELVLGASVRVPTLTVPVTVKVPAGSKPGRVLRVRHRGVPDREKPGDLLVTVELAVPGAPTVEERAAIETLAQVTDAMESRRHLGVE